MSNALLHSTLALSLPDPASERDAARARDDRLGRAERRTRVAVIGSGFGGLAAAIRLQAAGVATTIFEARDKPGGCAYVYQQDGFTFDQGPTVITAPDCIEELFALSNRKMDDYVRLLPVHPMYRLSWEDGSVINYDVSDGQMEREIKRLCPDDLKGYLQFVDYARRVYEAGYSKLAAVPFLRFSDMVREAPALVRLRADRSVYAAVSRFVRDERLRQALSFHALLVGGNPFSTSAIYTLIHYLERNWGVFFAKGGTGALVRALVKLFEELGGRLHLSSPVTSIALETTAGQVEHVVRVAGRAPQHFDRVISNADVHQTYDRLYHDHPSSQRKVAKLEGMDWSMSLFVLYFGTRRRYPGLAHHTILFGKRYRALLAEIFAGPELPDDFSLYLHTPTVTDADLAPPGGETFYVLSPVPHLGNVKVDWETMGPVYANRILAYLERVLPGLRDEIVTQRAFTPLDFQNQLGTFNGAAFSVAPRLMQSAYFRPHNRDDKIPGLYIVGSGTHPGAGVPGVLNSAKATASTLLADLAKVRAA
jgi:phytoene desaturase